MPQPQSRQPPPFNEVQMLQQQIMLKRLQELQRQKKLQELGDSRQPALINGTPVRDSPHTAHGFPNRSVHAHGSAVGLDGHGFGEYARFHGACDESTETVFDVDPSRGLDPLEQKILFETDGDDGLGVSFESLFDDAENSSAGFPSVQSGSWSALMQSAVDEAAAGSDSRAREEWSGVTFHNTDLSDDNRRSGSVFGGFHQFPAADPAAAFDRSGGFPTPNPGTPTTKVPKAELVDAFTASYDNCSTSPYFGLGLAPPTRRLPMNHLDPSHVSQQPGHSPVSYAGSRYPAFNLHDSQETYRGARKGFSETGDNVMGSAEECFSGFPEANAAGLRNPEAFGRALRPVHVPPPHGRPVYSDPGGIRVAVKKERADFESKVPLTALMPRLDGNRRSGPFVRVGAACGGSGGGGPVTAAADQDSFVLRSKKRKFSTFERLPPWHEEAAKGSSSRLRDTSVAELEWAEAANRLPEKVNEEASPKKRVIFTTQLMQLLFRPAPAAAHDGTVPYFAARLVLGDACGLANHYVSSGKSVSGGKDLSKVVEDFVARSTRLEDELLRFENGGSILDIRMESQELEKFSVINRFAKFHIRAQLATGTPTVPKLYPQRYVIAAPMPKTVPQGQNCHSL